MKQFLIVAGSLSLILGVIGIFVPLIPTTPFLLLTAACYLKSSPKLYQRLISNKYIGSYIINYREKKIIPLRAKIFTLVLLWGTMSYCIFFLIDILWLRILLGCIAVGVTVHVLSFD
jgi:uncharacterized protein